MNGSKHEGNYTIRTKDRAARTWDFSSAPLGRAADGRRLVISVAMDVTLRERAEAQRQALEKQLRLSQKLEAIGSLAGGVAHDFNNLLAVILSFGELVLEKLPPTDPMRDDLLQIQSAGERGAALTRQLLAFGRRQVLQPVPLDLNSTARGFEKMLRRVLSEDIALELLLSPDLGRVYADPGQVEQVLMNLVVNARDAMPEGGRLTIETCSVQLNDDDDELKPKDGSQVAFVQLAVTDTGSGIDRESEPHLFEPFFTTKDIDKGTGLGLSTVYGIVKQSGGSIMVHSELGRGTTFKIYMPVAPTHTERVPELSTSRAAAGGTETILVVEDEPVLREVAKRSLELGGYTVLTASDGGEALDISARHVGKIDLLLTDVVMPGSSGGVLVRFLVRTRPLVKVLYMSGYADETIVGHGVMLTGVHFIGKPFAGDDLRKKVRQVLDSGPRPAEPVGRHDRADSRYTMTPSDVRED